MEPRIASLRRAYLFGDMPEQQLRALVAGMHELKLASGRTLFRQGDPAERFFFLDQGLIKLFRTSPEGAEKIIEIIRPGSTFAEAVMFAGGANCYPVEAQALEDAVVWCFDQKPFLKMLRESGDLCFGLLASLSRRLHMLVNQIDSLTLQNATYRLVTYLLERAPPGTSGSADLTLAESRGVIAAHLAIQPESLSRILARLREAGLVEAHGHHITVRDVDALRRFIRQPPAD
jgi:CRP/FNR family transcriptional regulator, dissimilatory nitrate respiration regulator